MDFIDKMLEETLTIAKENMIKEALEKLEIQKEIMMNDDIRTNIKKDNFLEIWQQCSFASEIAYQLEKGINNGN